jgi:hypothetical protein
MFRTPLHRPKWLAEFAKLPALCGAKDNQRGRLLHRQFLLQPTTSSRAAIGGTAAKYPLKGDTAMMTIVFIALSVLLGAATPAGAFNPKEFWEQQNRVNGGSNGR